MECPYCGQGRILTVRLKPDISGLTATVFSAEEMIPAPCQGILAVECRAEDRRIRELLQAVTDPQAERRFTAERYLFQRLQADCAVPVGVYAEFYGTDGEEMRIRVLFRGAAEAEK